MDKPFSAYRGDDAYIFVCYAHNDADDVYPQLGRLHAQGINIWYDEGISPGTRWTDDLAGALKGSSCLLYFCSSASVASPHCRDEITFAIDEDIPILVVQDGDVDLPAGLKLQLGSRQSILRNTLQDDRYFAKLIEAVEARTGVERKQAVPEQSVGPDTPSPAMQIIAMERLPPPRRGLVESALISLVIYVAVIGTVPLVFSRFEINIYNLQSSEIVDLQGIASRLTARSEPELDALWRGFSRETRTLLTEPETPDEALLLGLRVNLNELIGSERFILGDPQPGWRDEIRSLASSFETTDNQPRINRESLDLLFPDEIQRWNGPPNLKDDFERLASHLRSGDPVLAFFMLFALASGILGVYGFTLASLRITFKDARQVQGILEYLIGELGFRAPVRDGDLLVFRATWTTTLMWSVLRLRASIDGNRVLLTAPLPMIQRLQRTLRAADRMAKS